MIDIINIIVINYNTVGDRIYQH